MGYVYPESSRGKFGTFVAEFENGWIREISEWVEGNLFCCKLKRRGRRSYSGRQSRPHFGKNQVFTFGVAIRKIWENRGCSPEKYLYTGKNTGVGGDFYEL